MTAERYHLGCGDMRLEGYVNVDVRETPATDLVMDLSELPVQHAGAFFSHAFFEHLKRADRVGHLRAVVEALDPQGAACYLGLPDFRRIAQLYLERGPGMVGPTFDLYEVYRYTHGDPEGVEGWYFEQLHKSLFDVPELDGLLTQAGFPSYAVFSYVHPGEPAAVSLGFYATRAPRPEPELQAACLAFLAEFDGRLLELDTLVFVHGRSRSPTVARALERSPARRLVHRVAHAASVRLAKL